jgi:hypothetical protein
MATPDGKTSKTDDFGMFCSRHPFDAERVKDITSRWSAVYQLECFVPASDAKML